MDLKQKINKTIEIRNKIKELELELLNLLPEIEKEMINNLSFEEDIKVNDTIINTHSNKRFIVEDLKVYYDRITLLPFVSPVLRRVNADYSPGNVKGVDNYTNTNARYDFFDKNKEGLSLLDIHGQTIHNTSKLKITTGNKITDFFKAKTIQKKQDIKTKKGYTNQSGYSTTIIEDDDTLDYIISHTTKPSNLSFDRDEDRYDYFLEIVTKIGKAYIYTTNNNKNKAVKMTQKKLKEIKELIKNKSDKILLMDSSLKQSHYNSSFHGISNRDEFGISLINYLNSLES